MFSAHLPRWAVQVAAVIAAMTAGSPCWGQRAAPAGAPTPARSRLAQRETAAALPAEGLPGTGTLDLEWGAVLLTVNLGRTEYLVPEQPGIIVTARNTSDRPVTIPDPIDLRRVCTDVWGKPNALSVDMPPSRLSLRVDGGCHYVTGEPDSITGKVEEPPGPPRVVLQPGQRIVRRLPVYAPGLLGSFQIVYCNLATTPATPTCLVLEFEVKRAKHILSRTVLLRKRQLGSDWVTRRDVLYQRGLQAHLVEDDSHRRYVLLDCEGSASFRDVPDGGGHDRVAEVPSDVSSLELSADADENITVSWMEAAGKAKAYWASTDRSRIAPVIPADAVQP